MVEVDKEQPMKQNGLDPSDYQPGGRQASSASPSRTQLQNSTTKGSTANCVGVKRSCKTGMEPTHIKRNA